MKYKILLFIFFSQITHIVYSQKEAYDAMVREDSITIHRAKFYLNRYFGSRLDNSEYILFGFLGTYILIEKTSDFFKLFAISQKNGIIYSRVFRQNIKEFNRAFYRSSYTRKKLYTAEIIDKNVMFVPSEEFLYLIFMKNGEKQFEMSLSLQYFKYIHRVIDRNTLYFLFFELASAGEKDRLFELFKIIDNSYKTYKKHRKR